MSFTTYKTDYWCGYCDHDCEDNECLTVGEAYCVGGELVGGGEYLLVSTAESLETTEIFVCDNCGRVDTDGTNPKSYYRCDNCGCHYDDWDDAATCCYTICSIQGARDDECHCFDGEGLSLAASGKMGISWCTDYEDAGNYLNRLYICHNCHKMFFHADVAGTITHSCDPEWVSDDTQSTDSQLNTSCLMCVQKQAPCLLHQPDEDDLFVLNS